MVNAKNIKIKKLRWKKILSFPIIPYALKHNNKTLDV